MADLQVNLKPGLVITVAIAHDLTSRDADHMKRVASLLITIARAIDAWQARHGGHGCPQPALRDGEVDQLEADLVR